MKNYLRKSELKQIMIFDLSPLSNKFVKILRAWRWEMKTGRAYNK